MLKRRLPFWRYRMKENKELERSDLVISRDMEVDCDTGQEIIVYIEPWFDVDKKFGLDITDEDNTWLNLYGRYNPFADTLHLECEISREDGSEYFDYTPTEAESALIKDMITEKVREQWSQTPQEFCTEAFRQEGEEVYVYQNRMRCSEGRLLEKRKRMNEYMEKHGYALAGSSGVAQPMNWDNKEYRNMIRYCQSHGITKIMADSYQDLAPTLDEARSMLQELESNGFTVEFSDSRYAYLWDKAETGLSEKEPENSVTMGGFQ